jgi:hypothetical protein
MVTLFSPNPHIHVHKFCNIKFPAKRRKDNIFVKLFILCIGHGTPLRVFLDLRAYAWLMTIVEGWAKKSKKTLNMVPSPK